MVLSDSFFRFFLEKINPTCLNSVEWRTVTRKVRFLLLVGKDHVVVGGFFARASDRLIGRRIGAGAESGGA